VPHETALIATIAIGLTYALIGGFLAVRLHLSPLVGYLLAGVAVGPFTPGFVADIKLAGELAEVGVILLMFGVGMHFSISDLLAVRSIALPGAVAQILVATALGAATALVWGWTIVASLIFGLALSVASTVVLLRALKEQGALDSVDGRIATGWLIVEDLVIVLALVLLPTIAVSFDMQSISTGVGAVLGITLAKIGAFVAVMLVVGVRLLPWLLDQIARTGSRELFTVGVVVAALGIAFGSAELFGVSLSLGAFFAGVVINQSDHSHRAAKELQPLEDAFAVLFFVSVGMLFDPAILVRQPLQILAVVAIIVFGKSLVAFLIVLAFRYPLGSALMISASLAQIGEFSFILVGLAIALDILPAIARDLILAGALLSITLNPLAFRAVGALQRRIRKRGQATCLWRSP
jgi:monovalent cation:H+ antiporter-2, CPA2 family